MPKKDLPVRLPENVVFDRPGNPLDRMDDWKKVACPTCGGPGERETDTLDTFFNSSWYFARFTCPTYEGPLDPKTTSHWLGVDQYIGGVEHAILHLLYARYFTRCLKKLDLVSVDEPFKALLTQGMVCHETFKNQEGQWVYPMDVTYNDEGAPIHLETSAPLLKGRSEKMSKSKKNVVDVAPILRDYGVDATRLFMISDSPPERDLEWTDAGIHGIWKYLNRVWRQLDGITPTFEAPGSLSQADEALLRTTHSLLDAMTKDLASFALNCYAARLREYSNALFDAAAGSQVHPFMITQAARHLVQLMGPVAPHLGEALWEKLGGTGLLANAPWPEADPTWTRRTTFTLAVQVNGKLRGTMEVGLDADEDALKKEALSLPRVQEFLTTGQLRKAVYIPGKVLNLVVS